MREHAQLFGKITVINNRRAGHRVRTGYETRPVIIDNDCHVFAMTGIGVSDEAYAIIRGNRCYQNALTGIGLQTGASALIIGNECYENKAAGIGHREVEETFVMDNQFIIMDHKLPGWVLIRLPPIRFRNAWGIEFMKMLWLGWVYERDFTQSW